jgi:ABC-type amino acid transport substrate-binding protein
VAFCTVACSPFGVSRPPVPPPPHPPVQGPAVAAVRRAGVLRVASDLSYPPLAFRERGLPAGFEVELAGLLAAALGVRLEIVDMPRASMRPGFRDVDLLISGWTAEGAPGLASVSYYAMRQGILWREGQTAPSDGSLRGVRVAVQVRSPGQAAAEQSGAISAFVAYAPVDVFGAVTRGAAQAAVGDLPVVTEYARTHPHLRVSAASWPAASLVVVVRADAPDLLTFTSAAIRELERQHGLDQLRQRWRL